MAPRRCRFPFRRRSIVYSPWRTSLSVPCFSIATAPVPAAGVPRVRAASAPPGRRPARTRSISRRAAGDGGERDRGGGRARTADARGLFLHRARESNISQGGCRARGTGTRRSALAGSTRPGVRCTRRGVRGEKPARGADLEHSTRNRICQKRRGCGKQGSLHIAAGRARRRRADRPRCAAQYGSTPPTRVTTRRTIRSPGYNCLQHHRVGFGYRSRRRSRTTARPPASRGMCRSPSAASREGERDMRRRSKYCGWRCTRSWWGSREALAGRSSGGPEAERRVPCSRPIRT